MKQNEEEYYPILFEGKWYEEKDCDDLFTAFYGGPYSFGADCSVYVGDGMRICPDGSWREA
jgi:hypothetical protein